jgi:hypothetical protein
MLISSALGDQTFRHTKIWRCQICSSLRHSILIKVSLSPISCLHLQGTKDWSIGQVCTVAVYLIGTVAVDRTTGSVRLHWIGRLDRYGYTGSDDWIGRLDRTTGSVRLHGIGRLDRYGYTGSDDWIGTVTRDRATGSVLLHGIGRLDRYGYTGSDDWIGTVTLDRYGYTGSAWLQWIGTVSWSDRIEAARLQKMQSGQRVCGAHWIERQFDFPFHNFCNHSFLMIIEIVTRFPMSCVDFPISHVEPICLPTDVDESSIHYFGVGILCRIC